MDIPQFVVMHQTLGLLPTENTPPGETESQGHTQLSELHNGGQSPNIDSDMYRTWVCKDLGNPGHLIR